MTKKEVSKFRNILNARVLELSSSARQRDAIAIEKSADDLENSIRATERELAVRNLESDVAKLREAYDALRRIQDGTYGTCMKCDEEISPKRLAAIPWATRCIQCQQARDCHCGAKNARPTLTVAA